MYCDTIIAQAGEDASVMKEMKSSRESDGSSKLLVGGSCAIALDRIGDGRFSARLSPTLRSFNLTRSECRHREWPSGHIAKIMG
jgi:hypothetical protein